MRSGSFIMLWLALVLALPPALCDAQDKTIIVRPLSDAPSIVKRALVIGVSAYEHATPLPETANDARAFADLLRTRFGFSDDAIILMTDDPATPDRLKPTYIHLRAAFKTLLDGINEKSEVVIFFSGHGIRQDNRDWLIPHDGLPDDVETTCIDYERFKQTLDTKRPARALLIVDACRNLQGGKDAVGSGFGGGKATVGSQVAELLSCQPKEISQIGKPEDFHESVFTHFLLLGLQGDPEALNEQGVVTFDSLKLYVQSRVSKYVAGKFGASQNPDGRTTLGSMVLVQISFPAKTKPSAKTEPDSHSDRERRRTDANSGNIPHGRLRALKDGAELVYIAAGPFQMGDDDRKDNPRHTVTLSGYYIYNLVTVQQYLAFCDATGHARPSAPDFNPNWSKKVHPIVNIGWEDAVAYCTWLSKETKYQVQLPTEAQWEKAARGTNGRKYPWGDTFDVDKLWCSTKKPGDAGGTTSVGRYGVSLSGGCTDMAGNVWQWCADWYDADFWGSRGATGLDPENQSVGWRTERSVRGGSWAHGGVDEEGNFRCAQRGRAAPGYYCDSMGFRCVVRADTH